MIDPKSQKDASNMIELRRLLLPIVFVFVTAIPAGTAFGKRLLHVELRQDGQLVLQTTYQDDSDADAATVWRYLGEPPLWTETAKIAADDDDPSVSTIDGELHIAIRHADDRIAEAKLAKLRLVREHEDSDAWFLPAAEVERTAKLARLTRPPKQAISVVFLATLVLGAAALLLIGVWLVAWRLRR